MENNNVMFIPHDYVVDEEGSVFPKGSGFGGKHTSLPVGFRKKLSKALPKEAIKRHPTKTFLSTIKAIFIVERMNDVFGLDGWNLEHEIVNDHHTTKTKDGDVPYVVMKGRIYIRQFDLYTPYQYGGHQMAGKGTEPADGYKSAVTDLQSKCASYLEIGIQVFKGQPTSQVANESKVDSKEIEKKETEEGVKQMTKKTQSTTKAVPKKEPVAKKAVVKKDAPEEREVIDIAKFTDDGVEMVKSQQVNVLSNADKEILSYKTSSELRENAEVIVFNANMDGATEDQLETIRQSVNKQYKSLINKEK